MKVKLSTFWIVSLILVAGLIAFAVTDAQAASGAKIKLELTSTTSPGSCTEIACDKFKEMVEKRSNGRIEVVRYPSGELYNPKAEIQALVKGQIAMALAHGAYVGARSPALELIGGFGGQGSWDDGDHFWRFQDLPETRQIAADEFKAKLNCKILALMTGGGSLMGNRRRPVRTVEDFKDLKVRTAGSYMAAIYKEVGLVPAELSSREVYMALQRGTIDGAFSTPWRFFASKWYEVTKYANDDGMMPWFCMWLSINLDKWNKLSPTDQKLLSDVGLEIEAFSRKACAQEREKAYETLRPLIKEVYVWPDKEKSRLHKLVRPTSHKFIVKRSGEEMGNKLLKLIKQAQR
jgi:TRAP-type C4-dicarboxylate transport system substrate-binding protein